MSSNAGSTDSILEIFVKQLDVPNSYYDTAEARYQSLGEWLHRKESVVVGYEPEVYPQGSFRYGTVIRPIGGKDEYDLDLVCQLDISKDVMSQKQVKVLVGTEVRLYAQAQNMLQPAAEKKRCWRLEYADDLKFHMDILPAVPEDSDTKSRLRATLGENGEAAGLADTAVAITDKTNPFYDSICKRWPMSNPRGFAIWFEERMRSASDARRKELVAGRVYASIEDVPPYEWKTPLQRAIQILKRHRDAMFYNEPGLKPISIIITTLAARSYDGSSALYETLLRAVSSFRDLVSSTSPRVLNPTNPGEDFADAWSRQPELERSFRQWVEQLEADLKSLAGPLALKERASIMAEKLKIALSAESVQGLDALPSTASSTSATAVGAVSIKSAPSPWRKNGLA